MNNLVKLFKTNVKFGAGAAAAPSGIWKMIIITLALKCQSMTKHLQTKIILHLTKCILTNIQISLEILRKHVNYKRQLKIYIMYREINCLLLKEVKTANIYLYIPLAYWIFALFHH